MNIRTLFTLFIMSCAVSICSAQVGFNNPNPDESSILDLTAVNKGLLIPRLTTAQRQAISSPGRSLLVFDSTDGKFYFYDGGVWYALNELVRVAGSNDVSLPSGNLSINGNINTGNVAATGTLSSANLNVTGFSTNALVPTGAIIMWSGSIATIPTGWALCDGVDGRPDLRERFIVGAGTGDNTTVLGEATLAPHSNGGANTVILQANNLPPHQHTFVDSYLLHNGSDLSRFPPGTTIEQLTTDYKGMEGADYNNDQFFNRSKLTGNNPNPVSAPVQIRPPYYALAFIIKLP